MTLEYVVKKKDATLTSLGAAMNDLYKKLDTAPDPTKKMGDDFVGFANEKWNGVVDKLRKRWDEVKDLAFEGGDALIEKSDHVWQATKGPATGQTAV